MAEATVRLAAALDRLEAALNRAGPGPGRPQGDFFAREERDALKRQMAALAAERNDLAKRLAAAETENARLQSVTAELSSGLDAAIGELKTVLEG
jgi:hypothetical protein